MLKKIKYFLDDGEYVKIGIYLFLVLISMILEVFSIGIIFPIISLILDQNFFLEYKNLSDLIIFFSPLKFVNDSDYFNLITGLLFLFLVSIIIKNLLIVYINFYRANFTFSLLSDLKKNFLTKITKVPYSEIIKFKSTDMITYIAQLNGLVAMFESLMILALELFLIFSLTVFLFFFDTYTSIFLILAISFFSLILIYFLKNKILFYGEERRAAEADLLFVTNNIINGIKEIKLSGLMSYFINNFDFTSKKALRASRNFSFISGIPRSYLEVIISFSIVIFLIINLMKTSEINDLIISSTVVFLAAGLRVLPSIGKVINSYNMYKYYIPTLNRIYEFSIKIDDTKIEYSKPIKFTNTIKLENINFSYDKKKNILENFSLEIKKGDKIGVFGSSGSGKSTLINLISGLLTSTTGKVMIDNNQESNFIITNLSLVSQSPFFLNDTIRENLTFSMTNANISNNEIYEVLNELDLKHLIQKLEFGLDTTIGERGSKFSGGQLQRLNIARAMIKKTELLILDEATNALDKKTEEKILKYIFRIFAKKTIILISHDKNVLKNCDKIITLGNSY